MSTDKDQELLDEINRLRNSGDHEGAIIELEKLCAIHPDTPSFFILLGDSLSEAKRWDDAKAAFQKALDIEPSRIIAYLGKALMYSKKGLNIKAKQCVMQALVIEPNSELALQALKDIVEKGFID